MRIRGRICDGKIVLDGQPSLPEGSEVIVEVCDTPKRSDPPVFVQFPLFRSKNPGTLNLSNQRIEEILEDES
jgi:hypothetical protein